MLICITYTKILYIIIIY